MEVVSVNLADVRPLVVNGDELRTGIFKLPAAGSIAVGTLGLAGDVQVNRKVHGGPDKAVYAYAREDIEWWESELGRALPDGFFGENLTLRGVDVSGAGAGERWAVGSAVVEVSEPRRPCTKLAAKVGDPAFIKRFARAGRPGAYLRVVREGTVAAGDAVAVERAAPDGAPTVAELAPGGA